MFTEKVLEVVHHSPSIMSVKTTRSPAFRFKNGEFAMIGLLNQTPFRAYSIVSTNYDDHLEFLSVKGVGPLTDELQWIRPGDDIQVKPKTTGSLCVDYLTPKENLILLSTGTGIAPFLSIIRDPETYERFQRVYLYHTTRTVAEQAFDDRITDSMTGFNLHHVGTVTRQDHRYPGRFWDHLNRRFPDGLEPERDGVMVCGSPALNKQCRSLYTLLGWEEGNTGEMGDFLLERAFVG